MVLGIRTAQFLTLGYLNFTSRGFRARQRAFTPSALAVDLSGKHVIVTGATSGLGRAAALALASHDAELHILARDAVRGEAARAEIAAATTKGSVTLHLADMGDVASLEKFASEFEGLDCYCLVNNAGIMCHDRLETKEGVEMNFGVNVLGTFALTEMLMPALKRGGGRVVTVSSGGMLTAGKESMDVERCQGGDLVSGDDGGRIDGQAQYARNKRCQVAMTEDWHRRYGGMVKFSAMHPGWTLTAGLEKSMPEFVDAFRGNLRSLEEGIDTILWLVMSEEAMEFEGGQFFLDRRPQAKHFWLSGTGYQESDVDKFVSYLQTLLSEKGIKLPFKH